jgi:hypothetical protein
MRATLLLALSIPVTLLGQAPPAAPSAPSTTASSKVWLGRYAEYEKFLETAVIDRTKGATLRVFFDANGLAASGALHREGYKGEIAGYRMDRVLGLDMVPPTVEVRFDGDMTSLKLWVLNTRPLKHIDEGSAGAPDPARWTYQLHRAYAFEDLVANLDRDHEGSPLIDPQGNLILLDHSLAFTATLAQPYEIGTKLNQIDRPFFDRLRALNTTTVRRAIGDLVDAGAIAALLARRDSIVRAFETLAARKGANEVFPQQPRQNR